MKILIIRFSSIGDIVLTTPVIRCIKKQKPEFEIHYITKEKYKTLLEFNPYIDKLYTFHESVTEVVQELKEEKFDLIIDLHKNIRSLMLKSILKKPAHSFNKLNIRKFLTVRLKKNFMPNIHISERYLKTVSKIGIIDDGQGLDFFMSQDIILPDFCNDFASKYLNYYVFAIGGTYYTKKCPAEKIVEIIDKIQKPIVLIGGKEDIEVAKYVENNSKSILLNTVGFLNIHQSALLMNKSKCVISHDTGMMHIASALRKPLVSIWGNTIPEFGMYPLLPANFSSPPIFIENKQLKCRPCSKLGFNACPRKHFKCMNEIDINSIAKYINANI